MSRKPNSLRGAALVIVIVLVSMLMVLILAFFSLAKIERRASAHYASSVNAQTLESSVLNLAIGQIRDASSGLEYDELWVSQPGMIRRYSGGDKPSRVYKLYSADAMTTGSWMPGDDAAPANWADQHGLWVDLNESAKVDTDGDGTTESVVYPIVDPDAVVDGFEIVNAPAVPDQKAPMPVKWLYVLRDGTMQVATGSANNLTIAAASGSNPIVGRIAFWADDESCKLNINTASEPTPWDTPRCITKEDLEYGTFQPTQKEYQRYPGHPYMTALSPVLYPGQTDISSLMKEDIYKMIPRVAEGGTVGGTKSVQPNDLRSIPSIDKDRLFATVDEFLFNPERQKNPDRLVDPERLKEARFFLTAQSRAPEVNLFGMPRVSIWPVGPSVRAQTIFDQTSVFCSTIGNKMFAFQRQSPKDNSTDWRLQRNQELYNYIVRLTGESMPGYGLSLASRWGIDHEQVCTEIVDYIRCTNLRDMTNRSFKYSPDNGQVVPLRIADTQGFGRSHTFSEFGFHFICAGDGAEDLYQQQQSPNGPLLDGEVLVEGSLLMEPFSPAQGFFRLNEDVSVEVSGLGSFTIDGKKLFRLDRVSHSSRNAFDTGWHGRAWGGAQGVRTFVNDMGNRYPFLSSLGKQSIKLEGKTGATPTMEFSGGKLTVKIHHNGTGARNLTQTIDLEFPAETFPIPRLVKTGTVNYRGARGATDAKYWWSFTNRYRDSKACPHAPSREYLARARQWPTDKSGNAPGFKRGSMFRQEDVVRTVVPFHGDLRLLAALEEVPASLFRPGYFYSDTTHLVDHTFADTQGSHLLFGYSNDPGTAYRDGYGATVTLPAGTDTQLTDGEYHFSRLPDVPIGAGKYNKWGDFDNGTAQITDGAYINKPDEGNTAGNAGNTGLSVNGSQVRYFSWNSDATGSAATEVMFSPNRMMPSPGMFGSLPTGVKREQPWQTLLFRPQDGHPGEKTPPDHLVMDLFWMPVIEPYPISEPFSTAGKVNLNYQIAPFTWIKRATALHGVMKSEWPLALPDQYSRGYKLWDHETSDHPFLPDTNNFDRASSSQWTTLQRKAKLARKPIDPEETLRQFEERFDDGKVFKTGSSICEVHLVREGESLSQYEGGAFWDGHKLTGENSRERPYANIYSRVTSRSNVFRVHYRVQTIEVAGNSSSGFDGEAVKVRTERRGSAVIDRFIDPNDTELKNVDFANAGNKKTVDDFYRYRILERREFATR